MSSRFPPDRELPLVGYPADGRPVGFIALDKSEPEDAAGARSVVMRDSRPGQQTLVDLHTKDEVYVRDRFCGANIDLSALRTIPDSGGGIDATVRGGAQGIVAVKINDGQGDAPRHVVVSLRMPDVSLALRSDQAAERTPLVTYDVTMTGAQAEAFLRDYRSAVAAAERDPNDPRVIAFQNTHTKNLAKRIIMLGALAAQSGVQDFQSAHVSSQHGIHIEGSSPDPTGQPVVVDYAPEEARELRVMTRESAQFRGYGKGMFYRDDSLGTQLFMVQWNKYTDKQSAGIELRSGDEASTDVRRRGSQSRGGVSLPSSAMRPTVAENPRYVQHSGAPLDAESRERSRRVFEENLHHFAVENDRRRSAAQRPSAQYVETVEDDAASAPGRALGQTGTVVSNPAYWGSSEDDLSSWRGWEPADTLTLEGQHQAATRAGRRMEEWRAGKFARGESITGTIRQQVWADDTAHGGSLPSSRAMHVVDQPPLPPEEQRRAIADHRSALRSGLHVDSRSPTLEGLGTQEQNTLRKLQKMRERVAARGETTARTVGQQVRADDTADGGSSPSSRAMVVVEQPPLSLAERRRVIAEQRRALRSGRTLDSQDVSFGRGSGAALGPVLRSPSAPSATVPRTLSVSGSMPTTGASVSRQPPGYSADMGREFSSVHRDRDTAAGQLTSTVAGDTRARVVRSPELDDTQGVARWMADWNSTFAEHVALIDTALGQLSRIERVDIFSLREFWRLTDASVAILRDMRVVIGTAERFNAALTPPGEGASRLRQDMDAAQAVCSQKAAQLAEIQASYAQRFTPPATTVPYVTPGQWRQEFTAENCEATRALDQLELSLRRSSTCTLQERERLVEQSKACLGRLGAFFDFADEEWGADKGSVVVPETTRALVRMNRKFYDTQSDRFSQLMVLMERDHPAVSLATMRSYFMQSVEAFDLDFGAVLRRDGDAGIDDHGHIRDLSEPMAQRLGQMRAVIQQANERWLPDQMRGTQATPFQLEVAAFVREASERWSGIASAFDDYREYAKIYAERTSRAPHANIPRLMAAAAQEVRNVSRFLHGVSSTVAAQRGTAEDVVAGLGQHAVEIYDKLVHFKQEIRAAVAAQGQSFTGVRRSDYDDVTPRLQPYIDLFGAIADGKPVDLEVLNKAVALAGPAARDEVF